MNNVEFSALSLEELFSINGGSAKGTEYALKKVEEEKKIVQRLQSSPNPSVGGGARYIHERGKAEKKVADSMTKKSGKK